MFFLSHYQEAAIQGIIPSFNAKIATVWICTSVTPPYDFMMGIWTTFLSAKYLALIITFITLCNETQWGHILLPLYVRI